jgi:HSP20 family protein
MTDYKMDPFDELKRVQYRLGQMLRGRPESIEVMRPGAVTVPDVDVSERGNDIVVAANMPGVDKSDIRVNVTDGNVLEISAEKKAETEKEEQGYIRHERTSRRYYRSIRLPVPVDKSKASASYNNGVLVVSLPMVYKTSESEIPVS